jgi:hypothetical protein
MGSCAAHSAETGGRNVRWGSFGTKLDRPRHVRFTSYRDRTADIAGGPVRANSGFGPTRPITIKLVKFAGYLIQPEFYASPQHLD